MKIALEKGRTQVTVDLSDNNLLTVIQAWTTALTGNGDVIPFRENILPRVTPLSPL